MNPFRSSWRVVGLLVIGPLTAVIVGSIIQLVNPTYMQDARDGAVQTITSTMAPYSGVNH